MLSEKEDGLTVGAAVPWSMEVVLELWEDVLIGLIIEPSVGQRRRIHPSRDPAGRSCGGRQHANNWSFDKMAH